MREAWQRQKQKREAANEEMRGKMKPKALACLTELELRYQCQNTKYQDMVECYNVRVESTKVIELVAP